MTDATKLLTPDDIAFLTRLFGPQLESGAAADVDAFIADTEAMKGVDFDSGADARIAIDALVGSVVHSGLGEGFCVGWLLESRDDRFALEVRRVKRALAA